MFIFCAEMETFEYWNTSSEDLNPFPYISVTISVQPKVVVWGILSLQIFVVSFNDLNTDQRGENLIEFWILDAFDLWGTTGKTSQKSPTRIVIFPPKGILFSIMSRNNLFTRTHIKAFMFAIEALPQIINLAFWIELASLLLIFMLEIECSWRFNNNFIPLWPVRPFGNNIATILAQASDITTILQLYIWTNVLPVPPGPSIKYSLMQDVSFSCIKLSMRSIMTRCSELACAIIFSTSFLLIWSVDVDSCDSGNELWDCGQLFGKSEVDNAHPWKWNVDWWAVWE